MEPIQFLLLMGWVITGFIGGIATGLALRKTKNPLGVLEILLVGLSWSFGWGVGILARNITQNFGYGMDEFILNFAFVGIIAAAIGGGCTLLILYRKQAST